MRGMIEHYEFKGSTANNSLTRTLSNFLPPHSFKLCGDNKVVATLDHAKLNNGCIYQLNLFIESEMHCENSKGYFFVLVKGGDVVFNIEGKAHKAVPGQGIVINNGQTFSRSSGPVANLLVLRLEPQKVYEATSHLLDNWEKDVRFSSRFSFSDLFGGATWRAIEFVNNEISRLDRNNPHHFSQLDNLETFLVKTVVETQHRESVNDPFPHSEKRYPETLKRAIALIRESCHQPLRSSNLAEVAGISERSLNILFNKYVHMPAMQYLKRTRLLRVYRDLRYAQPGIRVTDVASRWGFTQLGWFSSKYRKEFGELPSDTLQKGTRECA